jgi:hypothetical protein
MFERHYFQVPLSHCDLLQSSHVIGVLLLIALRGPPRLRAAAHYFQVPLSHSVAVMSSHVIGFPLVSLRPAVRPRLLPSAAAALCRHAVIPRHEYSPSLAESGRHA